MEIQVPIMQIKDIYVFSKPPMIFPQYFIVRLKIKEEGKTILDPEGT